MLCHMLHVLCHMLHIVCKLLCHLLTGLWVKLDNPR